MMVLQAKEVLLSLSGAVSFNDQSVSISQVFVSARKRGDKAGSAFHLKGMYMKAAYVW